MMHHGNWRLILRRVLDDSKDQVPVSLTLFQGFETPFQNE